MQYGDKLSLIDKKLAAFFYFLIWSIKDQNSQHIAKEE